MSETTPRSSSGSRNVQAQIDAMLEKAPPGSQAYKQPKFQRELDALYAQLHGGQPVVGREGRNV